MACKKTFESLHPDANKRKENLIITHPLHYYEASREYYEGKPTKKPNNYNSKNV